MKGCENFGTRQTPVRGNSYCELSHFTIATIRAAIAMMRLDKAIQFCASHDLTFLFLSSLLFLTFCGAFGSYFSEYFLIFGLLLSIFGVDTSIPFKSERFGGGGENLIISPPFFRQSITLWKIGQAKRKPRRAANTTGTGT